MNKIMQKLLEVTYPAINTESLLEIVGATPNPEIATEILCGLYVEPAIEHKMVVSEREGVLTFMSFDKWNNRVNYSYLQKDTKTSYFPKGTKVSDVTMENFDSLKVSSSSVDAVYLNIPTGTVSKRTSYTSLEGWEKLPMAVEGTDYVNL
jgi:hypothetical protein